jgi:tetratricopeptide (TPR) repeat protein
MLATLNSWGLEPTDACRHPPNKSEKPARLAFWTALVLLSLNLSALADPVQSNPPADTAAFARRAEAVFNAAKSRFQTQGTNAQAAWQFARAAYDWADFATSRSQRAEIAEQGIAACRKLIEQNPDSTAGHYYLAMNMGQLARTKELGALRLVGQMEQEFKTALSLNPSYDYGGPDRGLGMLYRDAPGWPASIGNKSKARLHLQKALKISPDYPENLLNLIEGELKWGDRNGALRHLKALQELWPAAQKQFAGEEWAATWSDWTKRRTELENKLNETPKSLETPRNL